MTESEKNIILEKLKNWLREKIAKPHILNTEKLKDLSELQINPLLVQYLAYFFKGKGDPRSIAEVLVYPRILGTSITTSFGTNMQRTFITEVLGGFGSTANGIDIEFDDKIDGRHKYCQLKSGPNSINKDDITTIANHFTGVINLARTNGLYLQHDDLVFCLLWGEETEANSFIKELSKKHTVHYASDFWHRLTGDSNFYEDLIFAMSEVAKEFDSSKVVEDTVNDLAKQIEANYKYYTK